MIQSIYNLDKAIFLALNGLAGQSSFIDEIIIFFAEYLAYILPVIFIYILYKSHYDKVEKFSFVVIALFAGFFARFGVESFIHLFYHRLRPFLAFQEHQLLQENSYSFPSGHASFFFAFSFVIFLYSKKWGSWFLFASAVLTLARVVAGVHYPSDITAGAILGIATGYVSYKLLKKPLEKIISKLLH